MRYTISDISSLYRTRIWIKFIVNAIGLSIFLFIFYSLLRKIDIINNLYVSILNQYAIILLDLSKFFTELLGYEVVIYGKTIKIIDRLTISGVYLDRGCMGRNVMLGFAGMIVALPGKLKDKLWYIPLGLIILTLVNVFRIAGLAVTAECCPEYSDINHYLYFKYAAWSVIFILWYIWINKFIIKKSKN